MKSCKRLEIVVEKTLERTISNLLVEIEAPGYTLLDNIRGHGDRGERRADEPTGSSTNIMFIVACESEEEADAIVDAIRPFLSRSGGICLVSDAHWVRH